MCYPRNVPYTFSCEPKWESILYSDSSPSQASIQFILFQFQKTGAILQSKIGNPLITLVTKILNSAKVLML